MFGTRLVGGGLPKRPISVALEQQIHSLSASRPTVNLPTLLLRSRTKEYARP